MKCCLTLGWSAGALGLVLFHGFWFVGFLLCFFFFVNRVLGSEKKKKKEREKWVS